MSAYRAAGEQPPETVPILYGTSDAEKVAWDTFAAAALAATRWEWDGEPPAGVVPRAFDAAMAAEAADALLLERRKRTHAADGTTRPRPAPMPVVASALWPCTECDGTGRRRSLLMGSGPCQPCGGTGKVGA